MLLLFSKFCSEECRNAKFSLVARVARVCVSSQQDLCTDFVWSLFCARAPRKSFPTNKS